MATKRVASPRRNMGNKKLKRLEDLLLEYAKNYHHKELFHSLPTTSGPASALKAEHAMLEAKQQALQLLLAEILLAQRKTKEVQSYKKMMNAGFGWMKKGEV